MSGQVEEIANHGGNRTYRTSCQCMDPADSLTFDVEVDGEIPHEVVLNINVETRCYTQVWSYGFFDRLTAPVRSWWKRIKTAWKLLRTGTVTMEAGFIFRGDEQIDEFCDIIQDAKNYANDLRNKKLEEAEKEG